MFNVEELISYNDGNYYLPPRQNYGGDVAYRMSTVSVANVTTFFARRFNRSSGVKLVYEIKNKSNTQ